MEDDPTEDAGDDRVFIGFPVKCHYRGGHRVLGNHGVHLWIKDGRLGHGQLSLTHSIPLGDVSSVDIVERHEGGSEGKILMAQGLAQTLGSGALGGGRGSPGSTPKVVTDVTVRTKDRQHALWVVEDRGGAWVRGRLTGVLHAHRIPFYDDLAPSDRSAAP